MKRLIIHGDPGIRKNAVIKVGDDEMTCFGINRNTEWHGPDRVQLWCIVGEEAERDDYERQNYIPHFLDVNAVDADEVEVIRARGE